MQIKGFDLLFLEKGNHIGILEIHIVLRFNQLIKGKKHQRHQDKVDDYRPAAGCLR